MGEAQKEVKIIKSKDMNLAVRAGELKHLLYIPQSLVSQGKGLLLNTDFRSQETSSTQSWSKQGWRNMAWRSENLLQTIAYNLYPQW